MANQVHVANYDNTILSVLPPQLVKDYLSRGLFIEQSYSKNQIIHFEGEGCHQIELIIHGDIVIERIGFSGDLMTINHFYTGNVIGANLIFSSTDFYPMTITAKKATHVIIIQKDILFELCNQYPCFLLQFIKIISDISVLIGNKIKNRISRTIRQSIIFYLNRQHELQHSSTIKLTFSKKDLAEMFGVSRSSLSRELQKMKTEGLIDFDIKSITVLQENLFEV